MGITHSGTIVIVPILAWLHFSIDFPGSCSFHGVLTAAQDQDIIILFRFCSDNMMIVNEMKTKVMVYGPANRNFSLRLNGKTLDIVDQYKYLGNITKSIKTWNGDIFGTNYQHLCNKARQAIFALFKRVKTLGIIPV